MCGDIDVSHTHLSHSAAAYLISVFFMLVECLTRAYREPRGPKSHPRPRQQLIHRHEVDPLPRHRTGKSSFGTCLLVVVRTISHSISSSFCLKLSPFPPPFSSNPLPPFFLPFVSSFSSSFPFNVASCSRTLLLNPFPPPPSPSRLANALTLLFSLSRVYYLIQDLKYLLYSLP